LRFVVASDGHLRGPGTESATDLRAFVDAVNSLDRRLPLSFVVIDGDIVQEARYLPEAKVALDRLKVPYLTVLGNHDHASAATWLNVWHAPLNRVTRFGRRSVVLVATSDIAGDYRCADAEWLDRALDAESTQQDVLVFMHITPLRWTRAGVSCPRVTAALSRYANVRAVFNGHDHRESGVKSHRGLPYLFDGHYGGRLGTPYRTFRLVEVTGNHLSTRLVRVDDGWSSNPSTFTWR
jgi:3',5'-cyclic-AMP phosphodiesterase